MVAANRYCTRVAEGGRVVIPAELRRQCGLEVGAKVVISVEEGRLTVMNADAAIQKAQAIVARSIPRGVSLSAELMAERKREAKRE